MTTASAASGWWDLGTPMPSATRGGGRFSLIKSAAADQRAWANASLPRWKEVIIANLSAIQKLKSGWNGPGSGPIDAALTYWAYRLLEDALAGLDDAQAPYIAPCHDGSLQIEWHRHSGDLEFILSPAEPPRIWFHSHATGNELEGVGNEAIDLLFRAASGLASKAGDAPDAPISTSSPYLTVAA